MSAMISGDFANSIAAGAGNPDLPNSGPGIYVVYNNHRYQLVRRNDQYLVYDISVFGEDGTLLTDTADVILYELGGFAGDVVKDVAGLSSTLLIVGIVFGFLYLWKK